MFDAKSLLEQLAKGASPAAAPQGSSQGGGLADILGQLAQSVGGSQGGQGGGGLADILGKLTQGGKSGAAPSAGGSGFEDMLRNMLPGNAPGGAAQTGGTQDGGLGGGLGDILGKLQSQLGQAGGSGTGSITDILSQVLGQATQGVKEGAGRISDATGAGDALNKAAGGQSADDLIAKLKDLTANNQLAAGAAAGGLGGLLVGTKTGRGVVGSAAKLSALALIGGLAYKAMQNYQAGKPLITGASALTSAAPDGTGFEPGAQTNESATLLIRTMIAAAAADGRIDESEKSKIIASFEQAGGFSDEARAFVQAELANPASAEDLAAAVGSQQAAVQVYTAARVAIEADSPAEQDFLATLADRLGIDNKLAAHIDATARSAAV